MPKTIRIVHRGEANEAANPTEDGTGIAIIRKRLQASVFEIVPVTSRKYRLKDTGEIQYSDDDGETWSDIETAADYEPITPRAELTPEERLCLASRNAVEVLRLSYLEYVQAWETFSDPILAAADLVAWITFILGTFTGQIWVSLVTFGFGTFSQALNQLVDDADTLWTAAFTELLTCILNSHASEDLSGVVSFNWRAVYDAVWDEPIDIRLKGALLNLLYTIGEYGLNKAGTTTAISSYSCGCNAWDITITPLNIPDGIQDFPARAVYSCANVLRAAYDTWGVLGTRPSDGTPAWNSQVKNSNNALVCRWRIWIPADSVCTTIQMAHYQGQATGPTDRRMLINEIDWCSPPTTGNALTSIGYHTRTDLNISGKLMEIEYHLKFGTLAAIAGVIHVRLVGTGRQPIILRP